MSVGEWVLRRIVGGAVPPELREEVLTDFVERLAEVRRSAGKWTARRWYLGQVIRSLPRALSGAGAALNQGDGLMHGLLQDVRFAIRGFRRQPSFAAVAVVTLALGVGANTAIFSVVDGILLRPLPYPDPEELVSVWADHTALNGPVREWLNYPFYVDIRETGAFEEIGLYSGWSPTLTGHGTARQLTGAALTEGMFSRVLKVSPSVGRALVPEDDLPDSPPVALLSYGFWRNDLAADSGVIGSALTLNGRDYTIIGVMPVDFRPPFFPDAEVWTALGLDMATAGNQRGSANVRAVGRLANGVSVEDAQRRMSGLARRLQRDYPGYHEKVGIAVFPLHDDLVSNASAGLLTLLAAAGAVLLIAAVNVTNLVLARTTARQGELAVRAAIGAGSGRIVRQLLTEGVVLAGVGGVLGLLVALVGVDVLVSLAPPGTPLVYAVGVDARVLLFALVVSLLAGALFSLIPALRITRGDLAGSIRAGSRAELDRGGQRLGRWLVSGQVALALILLVGAGLLVRSFIQLRQVETGFEPEGRLSLDVFLPTASYPTQEDRRSFFIRLEDRLRAIPGVATVGSVSALPLANANSDANFVIEGDPAPRPGEVRSVWYRGATPDYFEAMDIAITSGRGFRQGDDAEAPPVVVINQQMADSYFAGRNPIGARINVNGSARPIWREIVGVAANVKNFGVRSDSRYVIYIPHRQFPFRNMYVVLHSDREEILSMVPEVRAGLAEVDPQIAAASIQTLRSAVSRSLAADRFVTYLLSGFSLLALVLAVVGLYGVVSYAVNRRLREIGVRIALGASTSRIRRMVVLSTVRLVATGAIVGLLGTLITVRYLDSLLFGVSAFDLPAFGAALAAMGVVAVVAALAPALRAARVNPVTVMRAE